MSLCTVITPAILDTLLGRLAVLFLSGANGDLALARHAASRMLATHHAETEAELCLAAEIISFSFHALEALSQAATPDMPLNKILRLRGSAVSLSREAHKSHRRLDQLRRDRQAGIITQPPAQPEPPPARPRIDQAIALIEATREMITSTASHPGNAATQSFQKHAAAKRITENLNKNQAAYRAAAAATQPAGPV